MAKFGWLIAAVLAFIALHCFDFTAVGGQASPQTSTPVIIISGSKLLFSVTPKTSTRRPFRFLPRPPNATVAVKLDVARRKPKLVAFALQAANTGKTPPQVRNITNINAKAFSPLQYPFNSNLSTGFTLNPNISTASMYELLQPLLSSFMARNSLHDLVQLPNPSSTTNATLTDGKNKFTTPSSPLSPTAVAATKANFSARAAQLRERLAQLLSQRDDTSEDDQLLSNSDRLRDLFAMSMPMRVVFQALYTLIFFVAIAGNCLVIVVYRIARHWRQDISMFHLNLACADILLAAFCVPFTAQQVLDHFWPWPRMLCPIVLFLQPLSVFVSVYTLVAIGLDRLQFVRQPLQPRIFSGVHGKMIMLGIWCVSGVLAGIQTLFYQVPTYQPAQRQSNADVGESLCECKLVFGDYAYSHVLGNFILSYFIPLSILIAIYVHIGRLVWQSVPPGLRLSHSAREERILSQKKQIIVSLVIIVTLFGLAWLPLHAFVGLYKFLPAGTFVSNSAQTNSSFVTQFSDRDAEFAHRLGNVRKVYLPCHVIAMMSTCINPFVYAFLHASFRSDCRRVVRRARRWLSRHRSCCFGLFCKRTRQHRSMSLRSSLSFDGGLFNNRTRRSSRSNRNTDNAAIPSAASLHCTSRLLPAASVTKSRNGGTWIHQANNCACRSHASATTAAATAVVMNRSSSLTIRQMSAPATFYSVPVFRSQFMTDQ